MNKLLGMILLSFLLMGSGPLMAQQSNPVIAQVHKAIREANATALSTYFHSTIDLELGDTDGNFSRKQAEMIVRDFFSREPVKSFTIKHQGASDDGSKYSIGAYVTKTGKEYRVYILLKKSDEGMRVNQLQFEED